MNRGMSAPALWLLGHLAHRNEPLAGDLVEQFRDGRSSAWLWTQILCAIAMGEFRHRVCLSRSISRRSIRSSPSGSCRGDSRLAA